MEGVHRVYICFHIGFTRFFRLLVAFRPALGNQVNTLLLQVLPETTSFTKVIRRVQEVLQRSEANRPSLLCDHLKTNIDVCFVERFGESVVCCSYTYQSVNTVNHFKPELSPICYLLALLGAHHFLHVSRMRVKLLTFRLLMSYIHGAPILDVSRSHTTTQHSR